MAQKLAAAEQVIRDGERKEQLALNDKIVKVSKGRLELLKEDLKSLLGGDDEELLTRVCMGDSLQCRVCYLTMPLVGYCLRS